MNKYLLLSLFAISLVGVNDSFARLTVRGGADASWGSADGASFGGADDGYYGPGEGRKEDRERHGKNRGMRNGNGSRHERSGQEKSWTEQR